MKTSRRGQARALFGTSGASRLRVSLFSYDMGIVYYAALVVDVFFLCMGRRIQASAIASRENRKKEM